MTKLQLSRISTLLFALCSLLFPPSSPVWAQTEHQLEALQSLGPLGRFLQSVGDVRTLTNSFVSVLIGFLTVIAGLWFMVNFILGAYSWLSAGGNPDKLAKARDQLLNAVIGLAIAVAAYAIVGLVAFSLLGIPVFDPLSVLS